MQQRDILCGVFHGIFGATQQWDIDIALNKGKPLMKFPGSLMSFNHRKNTNIDESSSLEPIIW